MGATLPSRGSRVTALLAAILFCRCAAQDPAPARDCTSFAAQFPQLIALLQSPDMQPVVDLVQTRLLDAGLLQPAVAAVVATLQAAPPPASPPTQPTTSGSGGPSILRSAALYVVGDPPATTAHYEPTTVIGNTLRGCGDLLVLVDAVLTTPVPAGCALTDRGCDVAWNALSLAVRNVVATPSIRDLLGSGGASSLSEDDFIEIIKTLTAYFKSTNPDFSIVNAVVQSDVLSLVSDPQLHDALQNLLSTLEQVLSPQLGIQAALAGSLTCFEGKDPTSTVYRMVYALLGDAGFQTTEIVASSPAPADATVAWVGRVTHYLRAHPAATTAVIDAVTELLTQANASVVVPALLQSADAGLFDDASQLLTPQACQ